MSKLTYHISYDIEREGERETHREAETETEREKERHNSFREMDIKRCFKSKHSKHTTNCINTRVNCALPVAHVFIQSIWGPFRWHMTSENYVPVYKWLLYPTYEVIEKEHTHKNLATYGSGNSLSPAHYLHQFRSFSWNYMNELKETNIIQN